MIDQPPYTPRNVAMLKLIHQELALLWRRYDALDTDNLPARQREVLNWIRRGESRKTFADKMGVTANTVHTHEKAIFKRAGVASRGELIASLADVTRPNYFLNYALRTP